MAEALSSRGLGADFGFGVVGKAVAHEGSMEDNDSFLPCPDDTVSAVNEEEVESGLLGMLSDAISSGEKSRVSRGGAKNAGRGGASYSSSSALVNMRGLRRGESNPALDDDGDAALASF